LLWSATIITQGIGIALIAAISSLVNTLLAIRIHNQSRQNETTIKEVRDSQRIVITRTDRGLLITDEEMRELEPRDEWDWPWPTSP
jgi:hypothetical protein